MFIVYASGISLACGLLFLGSGSGWLVGHGWPWQWAILGHGLGMPWYALKGRPDLPGVVSTAFITEICGQLFGPKGLGIAGISACEKPVTVAGHGHEPLLEPLREPKDTENKWQCMYRAKVCRCAFLSFLVA